MAPDPIVRASRIGLGLILAVVIAAAGIRYGVDTALLRPVHRITASLEVPVALWVAWLAWQRSRPFLPAALLVLALTAALSVIGISGGQNPPPTIAAANLLGGLALVSLFAWMAAGAGHRLKGTSALLLLLAVQAGLGAWITIGGQRQLALAAHGILALVLAALLVRLALAAGKRRVVPAPVKPASQPPQAPASTSTGQCAPTATREKPTALAAPTISKPTSNERPVARAGTTHASMALAAAKAVMEWPDGKLWLLSSGPIK